MLGSLKECNLILQRKGCPRESGSTRSTPCSLSDANFQHDAISLDGGIQRLSSGDISVGIHRPFAMSHCDARRAQTKCFTSVAECRDSMGVGRNAQPNWADWKSEQSKTSCCTGRADMKDRRHFRAVSELELGEAGNHSRQSAGAGRENGLSKHTKSIFELVISDETARLHCRWWNLHTWKIISLLAMKLSFLENSVRSSRAQ